MIGIVGGVGPCAGADLALKIFNQTIAKKDQDHISIAVISQPADVEDRSTYLLGKSNKNPAYSIAEIIKKLELVGARYVGIACNTSHAPRIYDVILSELRKQKTTVTLIHMINEVTNFIQKYYQNLKRIGLLSTIGTFRTDIYPRALCQINVNTILPDQNMQESVHSAITDTSFGIKARSNPVSKKAKTILNEAIQDFIRRNSSEVLNKIFDVRS